MHAHAKQISRVVNMKHRAATKSSNKPVKHHHVNRSYLKRFCASGKYYQYMARPGPEGKVTFQWAGGNPNTTGYVEHLYDSNADTPDCCYVESELTKIENAGMSRIDRLLVSRQGSFNYISETGIATYIAAMAMRSPNAMHGKAQLDPLVKAGLVRGEHPNNPGAEGVLKGIKSVLPYLQSIQWYLYRFDGLDGRILVTSDRPVGLFADSGLHFGEMVNQFPIEAGDPGNWKKQAIFTFPLSPACAVIGFKRSKRSKRELEHALKRQVGIDCDGPQLSAWLNSMTGWQASRIYTSDKRAKFLLPNPPEGPDKLQFAQNPDTGIYMPVPQNPLVDIEKFMPAADQFFKLNTVSVDPNNLPELMAKVRALRGNGCDI